MLSQLGGMSPQQDLNQKVALKADKVPECATANKVPSDIQRRPSEAALWQADLVEMYQLKAVSQHSKYSKLLQSFHVPPARQIELMQTSWPSSRTAKAAKPFRSLQLNFCARAFYELELYFVYAHTHTRLIVVSIFSFTLQDTIHRQLEYLSVTTFGLSKLCLAEAWRGCRTCWTCGRGFQTRRNRASPRPCECSSVRRPEVH